MPFQVVYSVYQVVPKGVVFDFTAGDDITAICSTQVTLQATIYGDPQGHRFLWEQVEGSAVTWETSQTELTVTISFSDYDDKKFRFWVDKGSMDERYDDVWVWGTPTSTFYAGAGKHTDNNVEHSLTSDCERLLCDDITLLTNIPTKQYVSGFVECRSNNYSFRFTTPNCWSDRVVYYSIQEKIGTDDYTEVGKVTPSQNDLHFYSNLDVDKYYRIVPIYQLNRINRHFDYLYASCDLYTDSNDPRIDGADSFISNNITSISDNQIASNYGVRVRTKITRTIEDEQPIGMVTTNENLVTTNYHAKVRTKIEQIVEDNFSTGLVTTNDNINVPTIDILARDGTQIGG